VAESRSDILQKKVYQLIPLLHDPVPAIRGYTAMLLGRLEAREAKEDLIELVDDDATIEVYEEGQLVTRSVGDLAAQALNSLSSGSTP
jgi:hypothetical protein